ncbi:hypothetical protein [Chryseolinea lacunae]|uniref:Uncharacterized protein n=1 Tax=Chryseolinea lacunae TaxID=2801331 RepID=A0ABS1L206_9BACT|nr:hypothetical protein [Chryseolinea lacunae]MBL0744967.1 hypothetical protein [Chryseolinea lacunae]
MARPFFVLLSLSLVLGACTQRLICPAYQSAFIYDKEELRKKFSYFQEDSTPKILTASKTKYLIAEPVSYRKKLRSLQTVAMKPVNVHVPDSLQAGFEEGLLGEGGEDGVVEGAELDLAARSVIDSIYIVDVPKDTTEAAEDSVYMITKDKEVRMLRFDTQDSLRFDEATGKYVAKTPKYYITDVRYNVEQDNYMWYLRHNLILPDVRLAQQQQQGAKEEAKSGGKKKEKEKGGFFKNLFKKKKKEEADTTEVAPVKKEDDFDYVDEDEQAQPQPQTQTQDEAPKKKKGLFRKKDKAAGDEADQPAEEKPKRKKKEKKAKKKADETAPEEKEEEEEKDDGF